MSSRRSGNWNPCGPLSRYSWDGRDDGDDDGDDDNDDDDDAGVEMYQRSGLGFRIL